MARHFTKEEIDEIRKQLATSAMRDTDFEETTVLHDDDTVAIVQESANRLISVNTFRNELQNGPRGYSTYEIAVQNGYEGTEEEWLNDPVNGAKPNGIHSIEPVENPSQTDDAVHTYRITTDNEDTFDFTVRDGRGVKSVAVVGSYSPAMSATNTYRITLTDNSEFDFSVVNGKGIAGIEQTSTSHDDGGNNVMTVTLSDGTTLPFVVKNGSGIASITSNTSHLDGGENTITITTSDGRTKTVTFYNGHQGNTGSSVDYAFELLNTLDSTATDKGVTAAKIKELNEDVLHLGDVVETLS